MPIGETMLACEVAKFEHKVSEPTRLVETIPTMTGDSLTSIGKFLDMGYKTVFNQQGFNVTEESILQGWKDTEMGLYQITLKAKFENKNMEKILLSKAKSAEILCQRPTQKKMIINVKSHMIPSYAAEGFPTKSTSWKAIRVGNLYTWPMVKMVNKFFSESDEMQIEKMRQVKEGIRLTKLKNWWRSTYQLKVNQRRGIYDEGF
ncbi:LOW QUALITY PROTEIN: hypothetical protein ACHAW6_005993 [Cyclotella cf. meneghiniana]